ncbi:uncharacterized protein LOC124487495 [Hypomesus transpacificus]|uniref:uncharacterized protein LOC124487495 n=1 Tax=Hypomesus transpacificus TaxID=137520 RepID=UPI001F07CE42|nr:uncharacterized protein LOC124487495 [Hypomesus transpacificus]
MSNNSLEAALLLGDVFLNQIQEQNQIPPAKKGKPCRTTVQWTERDSSVNVGRPQRKGTTKSSGNERQALNPVYDTSVATFQKDFILQTEIASLIEELGHILNNEPEELSSAMTWQKRQAMSHERWQMAREAMVGNVLAAEHVKDCICQHCQTEEAVIRCRDCLPRQYLCTKCDGEVHHHLPLHNRDSMVCGFYKPLSPTTAVKRHSQAYHYSEQVRLLPVLLPQSICACPASSCRMISGKSIILIGMNGRYNLTLPAMECSVCLATWAVGLSDLLMSGYWPASVHFETVYEAGLFRSFLDLKLLAPGVLRQAFLGISVYGKKSR